MFKKIISVMLAVTVFAFIFSACGTKAGNSGTQADNNTQVVKEIRYLNFKPEIAEVYERISDAYKKETGIKLIVETAASGTYESTLTARMATDEAPDIFQINGPIGYASWADYCADLSDTELYKHLKDKSLAITSGGKVYGIPYVVEGYGIICNKKILDAYFALPDKKTDIRSVDEITSFSVFKAVVEDMQANREKLGINGVFASTSLKTGEDWRWQTHLMNIPVTLEFRDKNIDLTGEGYKEIDFRYAQNFRNIFDLYINNSVIDKKQLGTVDVTASMAEFALGKCAMVQNGNWGASQILGVTGNKVAAEDIIFLPIYMGIDGEEKTGICIGTENFICINSQSSSTKQKAAADFIYWLFSSETGKKYVTEELGFISPFDTFAENEVPDDPLAREVVRWLNKNDIENIPWNFTVFPSTGYKDSLGAALLKYAQGKLNWDEVKKIAVDEWKNEFGE
ncbi:MAG: carbohydrate ABC transporter substrate-binding protein [Clostridia bacterium]|nr:carbohydrate ABC transporter substrate-binding protein [Clostridia bacterium]